MTHRATGRGKVIVYRNTGEFVQAGLYNFDIDWPELKQAHRDWLTANIFAILRAPGSITLKGQASRTGDADHNVHLSVQRLGEVVTYLRRNVTAPFNVRRIEPVGEFAAAAAGQVDEQEDEYYRSVLLSAWRRPDPPPPPTPTPTPTPTPFLLPCGYYDFWIRYNTGLKTAWVLSVGRAGFLDTGGAMIRVRPTFEHFNVAMASQGFSSGQRQRLWDSYEGEPGPNGGYTAIANLREEIARITQQKRSEGCSQDTYRPGPLQPNPGRGTRDSQGHRS